MGLFDFFRKKDVKNNPKAAEDKYSKQLSLNAIDLASTEIEETDSFLPFGGVLTKDHTFQMVVYQDPDKTTIDHREHATIIQNIIKEKYKDRNNIMFFMAWDGVAQLPEGPIDCISVKVDNKVLNSSKIFMYTYKKNNGKVEFLNLENPMTKSL